MSCVGGVDTKQYNSTPLKLLPEPAKAPFLTLEDKLYCEYYIKRWNEIAETLDCVHGDKNKIKFKEKVFEIDYKNLTGGHYEQDR